MEKTTISFRADKAKIKKLDKLAKSRDRDRSHLINEAMDNYLEYEEWYEKRIRKALKEADAGDFATPSQVDAIFNKYKPKNN